MFRLLGFVVVKTGSLYVAPAVLRTCYVGQTDFEVRDLPGPLHSPPPNVFFLLYKTRFYIGLAVLELTLLLRLALRLL